MEQGIHVVGTPRWTRAGKKCAGDHEAERNYQALDAAMIHARPAGLGCSPSPYQTVYTEYADSDGGGNLKIRVFAESFDHVFDG